MKASIDDHHQNLRWLVLWGWVNLENMEASNPDIRYQALLKPALERLKVYFAKQR